MPGMTQPATARRQEDALLGRPRQAALLTAGVVVVTAVVFALVTDHDTLARIQRLDDAWLRLMISGTSCALATALTANQLQRRRDRLQSPAETQFQAGVPPARHAEDSR